MNIIIGSWSSPLLLDCAAIEVRDLFVPLYASNNIKFHMAGFNCALLMCCFNKDDVNIFKLNWTLHKNS